MRSNLLGSVLVLTLYFSQALAFNLPGHLPAAIYAYDQTVSIPVIDWYVQNDHLATSVTFDQASNSYVVLKSLFVSSMSIAVDHPKSLSLSFPVTELIQQPKLTAFFYPTGFVDSKCANYTQDCLRSLLSQSALSVKATPTASQVTFDLLSLSRFSEEHNLANTEAIVVLNNNGVGHKVSLDLTAGSVTAMVAGRPVGTQWPPRQYCDDYFITLPNQLLPGGPVMSEPIRISVFDCPGPRNTKKVIDLLVPVPGSCYHYRHMIHNENEPVQLTDYARVICWDPVGHGLTTAPESWEEFNMTIPFQVAVMDAVYAQLLGPRDVVMGVTHDRQSVVFQDWCWRPENRRKCAGGHFDEAWLFTICSPEFEAMGLCSSKYLFEQTLYPGGPKLYDIGNYDGTPTTITCANGQTRKLIAGFHDCLFDPANCGYNLSVAYRMFLNANLYSDPNGPTSPVPALQNYHNPNTGFAEPADWVSPMIPWSFFPTFGPALSYDPLTCELLPTMGFGIAAMTSSTVYGEEEIYQYELGWNVAVYGHEAEKRLARLGQQPLSIPLKKKWVEEKSGLGYPGATNIELLQGIVEKMKAPDGPIIYVLVPDVPGNAAVPLPDPAYFLQNYPTGRIRLTSGNFQHWMADAAPEAKVWSVLLAAEQIFA